MQHVKWEASTAYFDADTQGGAIFTEVKMGKAPFEYSLKTRKNIQPGQHYIDFHFTYFNDCEWVTKKERLDFKVNNKFEQHSTLLSVLAALALIVTIAHDGIAPLFEFAHDIGKYTNFLHNKL
ncbi:hypothetical protein D3C73_1448140 [compost metagenome]